MNNSSLLLEKSPESSADFFCLDLKSFYASVECVERGLDPFKTNLVVADPDRSQGTICLAVTPAMKALGVKNRCRVYEIPPGIEYIMAPPRMQLYIDYSSNIYAIYLKYFATEDVHVYSIDEAFVDCSTYKDLYGMTAVQMGKRLVRDIYQKTGITATLGVGTNLFLAKVALDIMAKHTPDNTAVLTEESYRNQLWHHRPLTDFWMIGKATEKRLNNYGMRDMYDIAHTDRALIYRLFGTDAELLIDHAWGRETTTMRDIKEYKPKNKSISNSQILLRDYSFDEAELIVKEMLELMCLELVEKELLTNSVSLYVGYSYTWEIPSTKGTVELLSQTSSAVTIRPQLVQLYRRITHKNVPIRHIGISFNRLISESYRQFDLFTSPATLEKERNVQKAVIEVQKRFGKNALIKGMNLDRAGTTIIRNGQIGGHRK